MSYINTTVDQLPGLSDEEATHGKQVLASLQTLIARLGGVIGFDEYMNHVLYAPGLGYYSAGATKFGVAGDFITAPMMTPRFGAALADFYQHHFTDQPILELGAGTGQMALDMLIALDRSGTLPGRYFILETSADLRQRQYEALRTLESSLFNRVRWLDTLPPAGSFEGLIVGNEVIDALPVRRFTYINQQLYERGVGWDDGAPVWVCRTANGEVTADITQWLSGALVENLQRYEAGYTFEVNTGLAGWLAGLSATLDYGLMLFFDYGYDRQQYYHPDRSDGTLRAYFRHHLLDDVLTYPGLVDITASVDFSALASVAHTSGLDVGGYAAQGSFLLECGLLDGFDTPAQTGTRYYQDVEAIKTLTMPGDMGDMIKVIALSRGVGIKTGFKRDLRYQL